MSGEGGKATLVSYAREMENPLQYNVRDNDGRYLCPACGFPGHFQGDSYDERGGVIATGICPCCLWEPGFDDDAGASGKTEPTILDTLRRFRGTWDVYGMPWNGNYRDIPPGWDGTEQLKHLFEVAPHLR